MKKFFIIIFSFFYLSTAMGVNVNLHYCHGEVNSVSLFVENGQCICDEYAPEGMVMTCCFDKNFKSEISTEQLSTSSIAVPKSIELSSNLYTTSYIPSFTVGLKWVSAVMKRPPPDISIPAVSLHILHSVFRL